MGESCFAVYDDHEHRVAVFRTYDDAAIFVRGYFEEYFKEPRLMLTIVRYHNDGKNSIFNCLNESEEKNHEE